MAIFLVCHGAWSGGWAWKRVRHLLGAAGHEVYTPTYSGLGERAHVVMPSTDLETHIQDILDVLTYEDLHEVVLVGHSYGGMVATGVADRAPERIARLIYIDAFVPRNGQCLFDLLPSAMRAERQESVDARGAGWLVPPPASPPDTSSEDAAWSAARRRWQPLATFTQPLRLIHADPDVARAYIYCSRIGPDDRFAPFAARARTEAGWTYLELDASHSPNITAPEALARLLVQVVG
jgi:pimeloyl-ACP methyl ester carboxylesterase